LPARLHDLCRYAEEVIDEGAELQSQELFLLRLMRLAPIPSQLFCKSVWVRLGGVTWFRRSHNVFRFPILR
jgi:hypothetical protein